MMIQPGSFTPEKGDILALCCMDYTGAVMYMGKAPGFGLHGGEVAVVQLIENEDKEIIPVDCYRLVSPNCCRFGWSRA